MSARIRRTVRRLEDRGASAVEYGLLVAAIAAVIVGVAFGMGRIVSSAFESTCSAVSTALPADGGCGQPAVAPPPADPGGPPADPGQVPVVP